MQYFPLMIARDGLIRNGGYKPLAFQARRYLRQQSLFLQLIDML